MPKCFRLRTVLLCGGLVSAFALVKLGRPVVATAAEKAQGTEEGIPVYRTGSYLVLVDAVVTDKHNRQVLGLSPKDFVIYEDGVPQSFESCRLVSPQDSTYATAPHFSGSTGAKQGVNDKVAQSGQSIEGQQYMVLVLDYATTQFQNQIYIRAAAKRYFRERLVPGLQVAVVRVGLGVRLLQNFTDQPEKIIAALDHQDLTGNSYARDRSNFEGSIEQARSDETSLTEQLNSQYSGAATGDPRAGIRASFISALLGEAQRRESRAYALQSFTNQQQSRPILESIQAIANSLANLPGRKTLVLISQGFSIPGPLEDLLYSAVQAANRARVAIYAVDSGGLQYKPVDAIGELHHDIGVLQTVDRVQAQFGESEFDRARQVGSDQADSTLRFLASATGGLLIRHTNDFEGAFRRIEHDSRSYYLLVYHPQNLAFDGRFRRIRVEVRKPGLEVRSRPGYFAMPQGASALSPPEFQQVLAAADGKEAADFPVYVEPARFLEGDGTYRVELPVEVPLHSLGIAARPEVLGIVRDSIGSVVASFRSSESHGEGMDSLAFTNHLRLGPGIYSVELVAVDLRTSRRSFRGASFRLEPVGNTLAVSSLVLSRHVERASAGEDSPWTVGKVHIFPCTDRRFHVQQNLIFYFDVYHAALRPESGRPDVWVTMSLERYGRPVNATLPTYRASELELAPVPHLQVAHYLKLSDLAPGTYFLRAKVEDRVGGHAVSTQASFELVP